MTKPSEVRFKRRNYGKNHAYYLDGRKLDGVTTLLSNGLPKPALVNWAANVTADYAVNNWDALSEMAVADRMKELKAAKNKDRDMAAARGSEVHDLAERIANGEEVEVPEAIAGHVNSAVQFLDDFDVETILTETSVMHEKAGYAGTFDLLLKSPVAPGEVILADWKTNRSGIFPETALQLTAYANATHYLDKEGALREVAELGITKLWAIWIRSDGYSVYEMELSERTWRAFGNVVAVARATGKDGQSSEWKGAEVRPVKEKAA